MFPVAYLTPAIRSRLQFTLPYFSPAKSIPSIYHRLTSSSFQLRSLFLACHRTASAVSLLFPPRSFSTHTFVCTEVQRSAAVMFGSNQNTQASGFGFAGAAQNPGASAFGTPATGTGTGAFATGTGTGGGTSSVRGDKSDSAAFGTSAFGARPSGGMFHPPHLFLF